MSLLAVAPGPLATIQDAGRPGHRRFGVPVSGPFDRFSDGVANALAGNDANAAVVELTGFGGVFEAEGSLSIAMAGAPMSVRVEGLRGVRSLAIPFATSLAPGDRLIVGSAPRGWRSYLAARGGWLAPTTLGSRSSERAILAGDRLEAEPFRGATRWTDLGRFATSDAFIRFVPAIDVAELDPSALEAGTYRVAVGSDRMGLRLDGLRIATRASADRLSAPVAPGTIQVAGGLPIVLGPACGTMGGYPSAGVVISEDLDRLAQLRPGSFVRFARIAIDEARRVDLAYRLGSAALRIRLRTAVGDD